jgi:hypothetical protein
MLMGEEFCITEIREKLTSSDFNHAPVASVDVERSFSKNVLAVNRHSLTVKNLLIFTAIYCNTD